MTLPLGNGSTVQGAADGRLDGGLLYGGGPGEVDVVPVHRGVKRLVVPLLPEPPILCLACPDPAQPFNVPCPRHPGDHRPQRVPVVPAQGFPVHGVRQEAVPVRVQGLAHRNGGAVALARGRVPVQTLQVDVANVPLPFPLPLQLHTRVGEDVPEPHPCPLRRPYGPHGPGEALDGLDGLEVGATVARALDGGHHRVLLELALEVVEGEADGDEAVPAYLQGVLVEADVRDWEVVPHEEEVLRRGVAVYQERGRGLGVERLAGVHLQDGRAGGVVGVRAVLGGGRATLGSVIRGDVAYPHRLEEVEGVSGGVDTEHLPEGVYGPALRQEDFLVPSRVKAREFRNVIDSVLVRDPYARLLSHVFRYLLEGVVRETFSHFARGGGSLVVWRLLLFRARGALLAVELFGVQHPRESYCPASGNPLGSGEGATLGSR